MTETGWKVDSITDEQALEIFERQHLAHTRKALSKPGEGSAVSIVDDQEEEAKDPQAGAENASHREKVLDLLRMTPTGFEHFCVRLLREHGFEGVSHEGGPGDKGIDGIGTLRINPFVSISVVFQSKRYEANKTVRSEEIAAFRGSLPNSVDKGILITSSDFTAAARSIARDSDKKPIELISGRDIVKLMENLGLGPMQVYDID